MQLDLFL